MKPNNPTRKFGRVWPILGGLLLMQTLMGSNCILDALARKVIQDSVPPIQTQAQQTAYVQTATAQPTVTPTGTATPSGSPTPTSTAPTPTPTSGPSTLPTITSFTPLSGPMNGTTTVFIRGTNFINVLEVLFNGIPAAAFEVYSPTQIAAITAPGNGSGPITVLTATGSATSPNLWTYNSAIPFINSMYPLMGSTGGGTIVNLVGESLSFTTQVTFNGVPAANFIVLDNGTRIQAITAPGSGSGPVKVISPANTVQFPFQPWTYTGITQISGFSPQNGPMEGGTKITILGANFTGTYGVHINGMTAASFTVDNDGQITATSIGGSGSGPIDIMAPGGTAISSQYFSFENSPSIESFSPTAGNSTGEDMLDIYGHNFFGTTQVALNGVSAASFTVVDDTHIQATSAAGRFSGPIEVTTSSGTTHSILNWTYLYPSPGSDTLLQGFAPTSGTTVGGTAVTLFGTGFTSVTSVEFAGVPAANFTVVNDGTIQAVTAPGTSQGLVRVKNALGQASIGLDWTYTDAPSFSPNAFQPVLGPGTGGTTVMIKGANFTGTTSVLFNGQPAGSFIVNSNNLITAVTGPGSGSGPLSIANASGTGVSLDLWTYSSVPVITGAAPFSGPAGVSTQVKIFGVNLTGAGSVTIAGLPALSFTVDSDTQITAFTAPGSGQTGVISVVTPGGSASSAFIWAYAP